LNPFAWAVENRRWALAWACLLSVLSLATLPHASFDFSLEQLYPQDSELAAFAHEHRARFGRSDDLIFIAREGDPLDPVIASVEDRVSEIPGILDTRSPASTDIVSAGPDDSLIAEPITPDATGQLPRHPMLEGFLIAPDQHSGAIVARLSESHNHHDAREPIVEAIEAEVEAQEGTWHLNGIPIVRTWFIRMMLSDLKVLIPLALLISMGFFIASFRDARHVLLGVVSVATGVLAASAAYICTDTPFNVFTPTFIAVVAVVGTSDIIHLVHRFGEYHLELDDPHQAATTAASEVGRACALTSLSTATGFLALLVTDIPPIRTFGLATGVGVMLTFVLTFLLVPPLLARLGPPSGPSLRSHARRSAQMEKLGAWVLARPRKILTLSGLLSLTLGLGALQIHVDHRILEDIRSNHEFRESQAFMETHMGAVLPLQVEVSFDDLDPREPEALAAVAQLADWLENQELVGSTLALPDVVQSIWRAFDPETSEPFPPTREGVAQLLLMGSLGAGEESTAGLLWEGDATHAPSTRVVSRVKDSGHAQTVDLVQRLETQSETILTPLGGSAQVTGVAWLAQEVNATLTRQFASSFALALSLIGVVWLLVTRSIRRTATALIPNLLPVLALLGTLGALNLALKPSTAMVLSIGLGIAVDDTIHFLASYEGARKRGLDGRAALLWTYRTAGRSILDTSIVLISGFCVFAASEFVASGTFGLLTALTVGAALWADFLVLGPLLLLFDPREKSVTPTA
jgi:predicted RND superfamily exporter protein